MRLVVVLCGPPGAGKSTLARQSGLEVFDSDDPLWSGEAEFTRAVGALRSDRSARAVVIRSGATQTARDRAKQLVGATHCYVVTADTATLRERVRLRRREGFVRELAAISGWLAKYEPGELFPGWAAVLDGPVSIGARSRAW